MDGSARNAGAEAVSAVLAEGARAFVLHPVRGGWEPCVVVGGANNPNRVVVTCDADRGEKVEVGVKQVYAPHSAAVFQEKSHDLLSMSELHTSTLVHVLRLRYAEDDVYTSMGNLLVALNPFKYSIPHYQSSVMETYLKHFGQESVPLGVSSERGGLRPHPWSVAHRAYHSLLRHRKNQALIVSGESGAGKTETCKIMLHYLCALSRLASQQQQQGLERQGEGGAKATRLDQNGNNNVAGDAALQRQRSGTSFAHQIVHKVQLASPILEAFGNAKTAKNDNSSRFGRLTEVQFDAQGQIVGMCTTPYLLERLRVVAAAPEERVFHSFYQLVSGAPAELKRALGLRPAKDHAVLCAGGCTTVRNIDDASGFQTVCQAFAQLDFAPEEVRVVWKLVAAVIHLMDIQFVTSTAKGGSATTALDGPAAIDPMSELKCNFVATELLSLNAGAFHKALISTTISIKGDNTVVKFLSKKAASDQRDTLCKHIYSKLFTWIIDKINRSTAAESASSVAGFVAVLDIFGFEDMTSNSLEQLCINLANEQLQRQYAKQVFEREVEDLTAEGISCDGIRFRDNQPCLDLLQSAKSSILSILDDTSALDAERAGGGALGGGGATMNPNKIFLDRVTAKFKPDFQTAPNKGGKSVLERNEREMRTPNDFFNRGRLEDDAFTVKHYATDVKYKIDGMVEKNIDALKDAMMSMLLGTSDAIIAAVLTNSTEFGTTGGGGGNVPPPMSPSSPRPIGASLLVAKRQASIASQFRNSLKELTRFLDDAEATWVRCIRPHPKKLPSLFDNRTVTEQLVAAGVLETVAQRQRAFPVRWLIPDFVQRFGMVMFYGRRSQPTGTSAVSLFRTMPSFRVAPSAGGSSGGLSRAHMLEKANAVVAMLLSEHGGNSAGAAKGLLTANRGGQGSDHVTAVPTTALTASDIQVGKTTVFMQSHALGALERARETIANEKSTIVARFLRAYDSRFTARVLAVRRASLQIQRLFRLSRRLRRCIREFYVAIWRRIEAEHVAAQKAVVNAETAARAVLLHADQSLRSAEGASFRSALLPLIGAVLMNIRRVEDERRRGGLEAEEKVRSRISDWRAEDATAAEQRCAQRLARERQEAIEREKRILSDHAAGTEAIRIAERASRATIAASWVPVEAEIRAMWARKATLERYRDDLVRQLRQEQHEEQERLAAEAARRTQHERALWTARVGASQMHRDVEMLRDRVGGNERLVGQVMERFFAEGTPSRVVSAVAEQSPRHRFFAPPPMAHSPPPSTAPPLASVRSFEDYASYWRQRYERDAAASRGGGLTPHGAVPPPSDRPTTASLKRSDATTPSQLGGAAFAPRGAPSVVVKTL